MRSFTMLGVEFRFMTLTEAEASSTRTFLSNRDSVYVDRFGRSDLIAEREIVYAEEAQTVPGSVAIMYGMSPTDSDSLGFLSDFYDCFDDVPVIPITYENLREITAIMLGIEIYDEYSAGEFQRRIMGGPLSIKTLEVFDYALERLALRGSIWEESYIGVFVVKGSVIMYAGRPVLYTQSPATFENGKLAFSYAYTMFKADNCIRLEVGANIPYKQEIEGG